MKVLQDHILNLDFFVNDKDGNPRFVLHIPEAEVKFENKVYTITVHEHNESYLVKAIFYTEEEH